PPGWTSRGLWGDPSRPGRVDRPRGALPREPLRASPPVSLHGRETPWRKVPLLLRRPGPSARPLRSDTGGLGPVSACAQAQRDLASCSVGGCLLGRTTVWGAARRSRTRRPTFTARPQYGKSMRPSQEPLRHTAWAVRPAREQHAMSHQALLAGERITSPGEYATSRSLHARLVSRSATVTSLQRALRVPPKDRLVCGLLLHRLSHGAGDIVPRIADRAAGQRAARDRHGPGD